jgi:hypothetical protein
MVSEASPSKVYAQQISCVFRTNNRLINIKTLTRRLILFASTKREAEEWRTYLEEFYLNSTRRIQHRHTSSYAPRPHTPLRLFTCGRDYFGAVTVALLSAQYEIMIASWMVSPHLWLTRPPQPPIRLDQLLKFKADQGVKIFVLLYQEVIPFAPVVSSIICASFGCAAGGDGGARKRLKQMQEYSRVAESEEHRSHSTPEQADGRQHRSTVVSPREDRHRRSVRP